MFVFPIVFMEINSRQYFEASLIFIIFWFFNIICAAKDLRIYDIVFAI